MDVQRISTFDTLTPPQGFTSTTLPHRCVRIACFVLSRAAIFIRDGDWDLIALSIASGDDCSF